MPPEIQLVRFRTHGSQALLRLGSIIIGHREAILARGETEIIRGAELHGDRMWRVLEDDATEDAIRRIVPAMLVQVPVVWRAHEARKRSERDATLARGAR